MQQQTMRKYHQLQKQTLIAKKEGTELGAELIERLKLISVPVGTWAGTDYIVRIRNGKLVPADTGDQGDGQM